MGVDENKAETELKVWSLCRLPFWQSSSGGTSSTTISSGSVSHNVYQQPQNQRLGETSSLHSVNKMSLVAKSLLPTRRRLKLDPPQNLYFPYEPGKQVRSAIDIKNTCKSHVAFKFQTTAPKSCYMRPPGGILTPGESIIATVFKFVEPPESDEKPVLQKSKVKFKIMSLKVKVEMEYVPEVFDEQKDQVAVEQVLRVVFLDPERPSPASEKLKHQLAEADAALESKKKPPVDTGPQIVGEGLVIDEWKERRERYLARQQVEGVVDSV
ncbi:hypothetical protein HS088_TW22G00093 [Tripterygium wilfordii]|uniref:MSP domain-containing protein n=1 Tax=Tripterygium wilfordii TaxID=458696 RepID=A0A7J7BXJ0_TRIWF|nr:vesicle-associated protein 4-1-like [Tripterygium wilfordii]KAF5726415.1 hypothetical protein HS088_TW22G00093 [Tripterygium wilfordii]